MTTKHMLPFLAIAIFIGSPSLQAETKLTTASELADNCAAMDSSGNMRDPGAFLSTGLCLGYLMGALQADNIRTKILGDKPSSCLPATFTTGQMVKIFLKYINDHPERLHLNAALVVLDSLFAAF